MPDVAYGRQARSMGKRVRRNPEFYYPYSSTAPRGPFVYPSRTAARQALERRFGPGDLMYSSTVLPNSRRR
jgi:hypothetical protein